MLIAAGALVQFVKFMQITLLIILPLLGIAVAYTLYTHYRRKKNRHLPVLKQDPVVHLIGATPEVIDYSEVEGDYVHFDHSALVKEYKSKLVYSHARYTALQKDYEHLQDKCNSLLMIIQSHSPNKKASMENLEHDVTPVAVPDAAVGATVVDNPFEDPACLKDIIEQKIAQIAFLQQQLDQRIRNYHQAERQLGETRQQLEEMRQGALTINDSVAQLSATLDEKETLASELRQQLEEKENQLAGKQDAILWLENSLRDTRDQNEMLTAMLADNTDIVNSLQSAVEAEQSRTAFLEEKLERNRQVMKRLFSELALCMEPEQPESPVIELRAAFVKDQHAGLAETTI